MYLFIGLPLVSILVMSAIHGYSSLDKVKKNWNEYRCSPAYMPFAGGIRPDITTTSNFMFCIGAMGNEIFKPILDALNALFADIHSALAELSGPLDLFRQLFGKIRSFMLSFMSSTFGKIANSSNVVTHYLLKIKDVMKRFVSQGYFGAYIAKVGIDYIVSFVMLIIGIIKTFVFAMLAISIILALFNPVMLVFAITIASLIGASGF